MYVPIVAKSDFSGRSVKRRANATMVLIATTLPANVNVRPVSQATNAMITVQAILTARIAQKRVAAKMVRNVTLPMVNAFAVMAGPEPFAQIESVLTIFMAKTAI